MLYYPVDSLSLFNPGFASELGVPKHAGEVTDYELPFAHPDHQIQRNHYDENRREREDEHGGLTHGDGTEAEIDEIVSLMP